MAKTLTPLPVTRQVEIVVHVTWSLEALRTAVRRTIVAIGATTTFISTVAYAGADAGAVITIGGTARGAAYADGTITASSARATTAAR
jgi:hypothetical protein